MNIIFDRNNNFVSYDYSAIDGYSFKPRRNIKKLTIVSKDMIKAILLKKINRNIIHSKKAIELMLSSEVTLISDCDMMIKELNRLINLINKKYKDYFNEFEYFNLVNDIYKLNMEIELKKKFISEE